MATCNHVGCGCKILYTHWSVGNRTGACEACGHDKREHERTDPASKNIGRPEAQQQLSRRKREACDIGRWDQCTREYFNTLDSVLPGSGAALQTFLENTSQPIKKIALQAEEVCILRQHSGFSELVDQICDFDAPVDAFCESMSASLVTMCKAPFAVTNDCEYSMITFLDTMMRLFEVFVNEPRRRNACTKTSGSFKPASLLCNEARGDVFVVGEERLYAAYVPGVVGRDPAADNIHKTRFHDWERCYGSVPYIFAYDALGSSTRLDFNFGVLDRATESFVPLFTGDLADYSNRAKFAYVLVKLLPVLKSIMHPQRKAVTPLYSQQQSWSGGQRVKKTVNMVHTQSELFVEKKWEWIVRTAGVMNECVAEAYDFINRLIAVFSVLNDQVDNSEAFRLFRTHTSTPLRLRLTGIKVADGQPRYSEGTEETIGVEGFFTPRAVVLTFDSVSTRRYLQVLINLALCVEFLHQLGIVHNDIRRQNFGLAPNQAPGGLQVVLYDFDDAYLLSGSTTQCPAMPHLGLEEHSAKSHQPHGKEVDVWAIGHLLSGCSFGAIAQLGSQIKLRFEEWPVSKVIERMRVLLDNLPAEQG